MCRSGSHGLYLQFVGACRSLIVRCSLLEEIAVGSRATESSKTDSTLTNQDDLQRFRPFLKALAERELQASLRQKVDASDIVQQTMLQAVESEHQWRGHGDAAKAGWLKAILLNVTHGVSRRFRRQGRNVDRERSLDRHSGGRGSNEDSSGVIAQDLDGGHTSPSLALQSHEERERILGAIEKLSPEQKQVLLLRYWEDHSLAEIAERLGKSPDAVAGLLYRAMKVMRSELT